MRRRTQGCVRYAITASSSDLTGETTPDYGTPDYTALTGNATQVTIAATTTEATVMIATLEGARLDSNGDPVPIVELAEETFTVTIDSVMSGPAALHGESAMLATTVTITDDDVGLAVAVPLRLSFEGILFSLLTNTADVGEDFPDMPIDFDFPAGAPAAGVSDITELIELVDYPVIDDDVVESNEGVQSSLAFRDLTGTGLDSGNHRSGSGATGFRETDQRQTQGASGRCHLRISYTQRT